ncbi:MAG: signal recognition particle-docking protein FtsY, partial [Oscillospiraceae bacterium]|nr:signal recognition particle-docking protein FtsY [Oscillospiraceae bacterium]
EQNLPVKFIGVGEGVDDLQQFNPDDFAKALFDD